MQKTKRRGFSTNALIAAEKSQAAFNHLGRTGGRIISLATGSDAEAYRQLNWSSPKDANLSDFHTVYIKPDNRLRSYSLPRNWIDTAVLTASVEAMRDALPDRHPEDYHQAAAYLTRRRTLGKTALTLHIGLMSSDEPLLVDINNSRNLALGMRRGPGGSDVAFGYWIPDENRLCVPHDLVLQEPFTRQADFDEHFGDRGVRLV